MGDEIDVGGTTLDDETRCRHHGGERDVVAFRFRCCGEWYACRACHDEASDHEAETWDPGDVHRHAVLCGVCDTTMTIDTYVACGHACPYCGTDFNPGCAAHWERYFRLGG